MDYKTDYKLVEGDKKTFEESLNKASKDGYICCGSISTTLLGAGFWFIQLMSRKIPVEK